MSAVHDMIVRHVSLNDTLITEYRGEKAVSIAGKHGRNGALVAEVIAAAGGTVMFLKPDGSPRVAVVPDGTEMDRQRWMLAEWGGGVEVWIRR